MLPFFQIANMWMTSRGQHLLKAFPVFIHSGCCLRFGARGLQLQPCLHSRRCSCVCETHTHTRIQAGGFSWSPGCHGDKRSISCFNSAFVSDFDVVKSSAGEQRASLSSGSPLIKGLLMGCPPNWWRPVGGWRRRRVAVGWLMFPAGCRINSAVLLLQCVTAGNTW